MPKLEDLLEKLANGSTHRERGGRSWTIPWREAGGKTEIRDSGTGGFRGSDGLESVIRDWVYEVMGKLNEVHHLRQM